MSLSLTRVRFGNLLQALAASTTNMRYRGWSQGWGRVHFLGEGKECVREGWISYKQQTNERQDI